MYGMDGVLRPAVHREVQYIAIVLIFNVNVGANLKTRIKDFSPR